MSSVLAALYPDISSKYVHLISCWWRPLYFNDITSWHYLCRSTKWLPAKLCLQCCSKCMTRSCILTHTVKVISYPPLQHPVKLPWHRLVHFSLLHAIINTSLDSSFFSLSWSVLSLCFISWDLLYFCLFWTRFCVLEFAIASLLQHKPKLTPQSHLCNHPSIVPLEALDMCALVCKCFVIHRNPCAASVIKTLIQEHRQIQRKFCCWHSAEKYNPINHISRRSLCLPMCRQQYNLIEFQVPSHLAYLETWTWVQL